MIRGSIALGVTLGMWKTSLGTTVQTPAQLANPTTGQIPNSSPIAQEYYLGPISIGQSTTGAIVGAVYPDKASLSWYEFQSDGTTPVIFDMYGTDMGFGGGGFGASNDGELAVYDSQGNFIADNKGSVSPATGESNIAPTVPSGAPPAPVKYRQPVDPTQPVYTYSSSQSTWFAENNQGLANLAFVANPQSNPLWNPSNPNYNPAAPRPNWNQYPILPAGTYFLAVTGFSTYFSGDPDDTAEMNDPNNAVYSGGDTATTPFGFLTFHAMSGTYQLNARIAGDFDADSKATTTDLQLLQTQVRQYAPTLGIPAAGFTNSDPTQPWAGLPSNLQLLDLTGNQRIDAYDVTSFGNYTGIAVPAVLTWNNTGATGDGMTWDAGTTQNFNNGANPTSFSNGAYVFLNDTNNSNYNISISGTISPTAITVNNSNGNYVISGAGHIGGAAYFVKAGTGSLTISNVNTYTDYTYVTAGTLTLSSSGSLASDSLTVALGATANINGLLTATPDVTANGAFTFGAITGSGIHPRNLSSLTIGSGGVASLAAPVGNIHANRTLLLTPTLSIAGSTDSWTGQLDLGGNDMIVHGGDLPTITNQIKSGFNQSNSGFWNGQGITSSAAAADSSKLTAVGVISDSNGLYSTFDGQSVGASDILVKYTYFGDANLDGKVNGSDYTLIDDGFNTHQSGWFNGDFNYDGVVNGDDYLLIDNSFNSQTTPLIAATEPAELIATTAEQISSVPEPTMVSLLAIGAMGLLSRRNRITKFINNQLQDNRPSEEDCLN